MKMRCHGQKIDVRDGSEDVSQIGFAGAVELGSDQDLTVGDRSGG